MRTIKQKTDFKSLCYMYFSPGLESMNASNLKIPSLLKNKTHVYMYVYSIDEYKGKAK